MLLNNFGNTCYINSVLQIFLNNHAMTSYIKSVEYSKNSLLYYLKHLDQGDNLKNFLIKLQDILKNNMTINEQNDANEIYTKLIEIFEQEDDGVSKLFTGTTKKIFKCKRCKNIRESKESFVNTNLYINDESTSLQESILSTFTTSVIDGLECEHCNLKTQTDVKYTISKWPKNLIFTINRFSLNSKISHDFEYTKYIDICNKGSTNKYILVGIINHIGSQDSGHYTYIKIDRDKYTEFDDDKIRDCTNFKSKFNYMLIYTLI